MFNKVTLSCFIKCIKSLRLINICTKSPPSTSWNLWYVRFVCLFLFRLSVVCVFFVYTNDNYVSSRFNLHCQCSLNESGQWGFAHPFIKHRGFMQLMKHRGYTSSNTGDFMFSTQMDSYLLVSREFCAYISLLSKLLHHFALQDKDARRDEKLKFTCRCSFIEIYNEQILDLLDPSSVNLQVLFSSITMRS